MLQSVLQQYDDVQEVLQEHSPTEMRRLIGIDKELLGEIVNFLSVFHEATVALEGESEPTIHLVIPWIKKLTRHCQTTDDGSDNVATLKNACVDLIEEKCHIHILHKVAVFLNPRQKSMKVLQPQEREAVIAYVNDVIDDMPLRPGTTTLTDSQPRSKRSRLDSVNDFDDDLAEHSHMVAGAFWQASTTALLAKNILCVMATSAASERNFSVAGNVVTERRTNLKSSQINDILLINSALKHCRAKAKGSICKFSKNDFFS